MQFDLAYSAVSIVALHASVSIKLTFCGMFCEKERAKMSHTFLELARPKGVETYLVEVNQQQG